MIANIYKNRDYEAIIDRIEIDDTDFTKLIKKLLACEVPMTYRKEPNPHYAKNWDFNYDRNNGSFTQSFKNIHVMQWHLNILGNVIVLEKSDAGYLPTNIDEIRVIGEDWEVRFHWINSAAVRHPRWEREWLVDDVYIVNFESFKMFWALTKLFGDNDFNL